MGFLGGTLVKNPPANLGNSGHVVQSLVREDPTCLKATKPMHLNNLAKNK